mmetsp:Transcript_11054/g.27026  ORF Transcript_11054/g.27026 Transcript_11054/m.27026 type:complete len:169 (-) Transcript_11054:313-819(-)|eukprot:CAMPEP_0178994840 /NCGR_PEP_ID=MMETSP0795-20121207/7504_1 /TAXON_ID=88552 /ORGANISM="Amoebophrya sp., Strain Ameob2" /LENGTH=168 /DNA_ID=CAMNT_0020687099 /DNA_START=143 /DNA_END=649 /DNA_ORIENTATION=+
MSSDPKKNKPPRPTLKVFQERGGAVERGFPVPGAFIVHKDKEDKSKPHTDRIFDMLKDMNERDAYFLGEPRSAFVKTRTDHEGVPKLHIDALNPKLDRHREIVAEEAATDTTVNSFLNTTNRDRRDQMVLNTLSTFELSPTNKSKAKKEAAIPKVPLTRLFPATGKII